jgi:MtfA peptidase
VVPWRSLKEGFSAHDDGQHLGLHEMAHALRLINIIENDEYDFYDRKTMQQFDAEAKKEIEAMTQNPEGASFFRTYASSNLEEFFAVAVELFFERPKSLKRHNATLYSLLAKTVKIDPIAKSHRLDMGAKAETKPTNSHFHQYYSLYKQTVTIVHH